MPLVGFPLDPILRLLYQVTALFNSEMKKAGHTLNSHLCTHFTMSRADLFSIIKVKRLRNFDEVIREAGAIKDAIGCEICKPAVGSILSSLYAQKSARLQHIESLVRYNEHIMKPEHRQNQDTNDRFLANIQRDGTFSIVPRIAAGEITPEGLIAIGQVAKKYKLYTKVGGRSGITSLSPLIVGTDNWRSAYRYVWCNER